MTICLYYINPHILKPEERFNLAIGSTVIDGKVTKIILDVYK